VYGAGWDAVTVNQPTGTAIGASQTLSSITISASAANGKSNNKVFWLGQSAFTTNSESHYCVNLTEGGNAIGRLDVQYLYENGKSSVTVGQPTCQDGAVGSSSTRTSVTIKATANNNASNSKSFALEQSSYSPTSGRSDYCVNLKEGSTVVGRIDIQGVYGNGYTAGTAYGQSSVTVGQPTCPDSAVGSSSTRTSIAIKATASNSAYSSKSFTLDTSSYSPTTGVTNNCVVLKEGSTVVGRIDIQGVYGNGYSAGAASVTPASSVTIDSVSAEQSGTNTQLVRLTAEASNNASGNGWLYLTNEDTYVAARIGGWSGTVVGSCSHNNHESHSVGIVCYGAQSLATMKSMYGESGASWSDYFGETIYGPMYLGIRAQCGNSINRKYIHIGS
jgi:hypothetical protein